MRYRLLRVIVPLALVATAFAGTIAPAQAAPSAPVPVTTDADTEADNPHPTGVTTAVDDTAEEPAVDVAPAVGAERVELIDERTEFTKVWVNPDGTQTVESALLPLHWTKDGEWVDVDSHVIAEGNGFRSASNAWTARFSPLPLGVSISTPDGVVSFSPVGAAAVAPQALPEGNGVIYPDAWPGADLVYRVSAAGVKEDIVLKSAPTVDHFDFTTGTQRFVADGEILAPAADGNLGVLTPAEVFDASGKLLDADVSIEPTTSWLRIVPKLRIEFDQAYLAGLPSSAYPIAVDPGWTWGASHIHNYRSSGQEYCNPCGYVRVGNSREPNNTDNYWRTVAYFDYSQAAGTIVTAATITVTGLTFGSANGYTMGVTHASAYSHGGAYPGFGVKSPARPVGTGDYFDVTAFYKSMVDQGQYGAAVGFFGQETSNLYTYKAFNNFTLSITSNLPTVPTAPRNIAVSAAGDGSATVSWTAPSSNGGAAISGYLVTLYPAGSSTANNSYFCPGACTSSTWTGFGDGTSWYFKVKARNSVGDSAAATSANFTAYHLPGATADVTAWAGNGQALVTWTKASLNGGPALDYYLVNAYDNTTGTSNFQNTCGTCAQFVFPGLVNGRSYTFAVRAHNQWGWAPTWDTADVAVTPSATPPPYPPQSPTASAGNASAWLQWEKPLSNGAAAPYTYPTEYAIQAYDGTSFVRQVNVPAASGQHNTYKFTALTNGRSYTFRIYPRNAAGYGAFVATNAVTPVATPPPFPPRNLTATPGNSSILVQWDTPDPSGPPATSYTVWQFNKTTGAQEVRTTPLTFALMAPLTNGNTYVYLVLATGANGSSTWSISNEATPTGSLVLSPLQPTNVQATRGDKQATVTWTAPTVSAPGVPEYDIQAYRASDNVAVGTLAHTTATNAVVTGLMNGTPVYFKVTAVYVGIAGPQSAPSNTVTPAGPPFAPVSVAATPGDTTATVTWQPPPARADGTPGNNGDPITKYTVIVSPGGATHDTLDGSATSLTVPGLKNGTSYTFTVRGTNTVGVGQTSAASNAVTPAGVPFAPVNVSAVAGNGAATVTWQAPPAHADGTPGNNGSAILRYVVTASPGGQSATTPNGTTTSIPVTGLANGTTYTFTVRAVNAIGNGLVSAPSNAVTPAGPPLAPSGVTASAGDRYAVVQWSPANGNGSEITSYRITAPGVTPVNVSGEQTSVVIGGLTNGTSYAFTVTATNTLGQGAPRTSNTVTPAGPPSKPLNVTATAGNASATVTWSASSPNGATPSYLVLADPGTRSMTTSGTTVAFPDLSNGTTYTFTVIASNSAGSSPSSAPSNPVTPEAECSEGAAFGGGEMAAAGFGDDCNPVLIFECNNGEDDDNDGEEDWPDDPDCTSTDDNSEGRPRRRAPTATTTTVTAFSTPRTGVVPAAPTPPRRTRSRRTPATRRSSSSRTASTTVRPRSGGRRTARGRAST